MTWHSSPEIANISHAVVSALGELSDVPKGREAKIPTKTGASYGYRYADLADALSMVRPILAKYGLVVMQNASNPDNDTVKKRLADLEAKKAGQPTPPPGQTLPLPENSTTQNQPTIGH